MTTGRLLSRRGLLGALAGAALAPEAGPARLRAAAADRITLGIIGAGPAGAAHAAAFGAMPDVQVIAVCDVDARRRDAVLQAVSATPRGRGCRPFRDFRQLLTRPDLDAVVIATPDHWHAVQTVLAARAGKHIYCEAPLCRTVAEGRAMVDAVRQACVTFQFGAAGRSDARRRQACEWVRSGRIGRVHTVRVAAPGGRQARLGETAPPPAWLDWQLWLGPAPDAPFSPDRIDAAVWGCMEDYTAGGAVSGRGVYEVDTAQWGLERDLSGPESIVARAVYPTDGPCDTPITWHAEYSYPGVRVIFTSSNEAPEGVRFDGAAGSVVVSRTELLATPESVVREPMGIGDAHLYRSDDHRLNWLECIRTGRAPIAPVEVAQRAQTICGLSAIAASLGRSLKWSAKLERALDDPTANRLLSRAMREPWSV